MPINRETVFVIPTHRLKEVGDTVRAYDEHFWRNGHAIKLIVFDDSSVANHNKYFSDLENTATYNPLFYVGPKEKEQFIEYLGARVLCERNRTSDFTLFFNSK